MFQPGKPAGTGCPANLAASKSPEITRMETDKTGAIVFKVSPGILISKPL